jgi:hypothetical protein
MNIARLRAAGTSGLLLVALSAFSPPAGASLEPSNVWANLGHEGSGLQRAEPAVTAFANLGREGSGLVDAWQAAKLRPCAA